MEWCARQPKAAQAQRYAALQRSGSLFPVLENFLAFVASYDLKRGPHLGQWCRIDNMLLAELYRRLKLRVSWQFFNDRCFRLLTL